MYLEGTVKELDSIRYATKEGMEARGVEVFVEQEITKVLPDEHKVEVKDLKTGETRTETYDKLILSPGSYSFVPPIEGIDLKGVYGFGGRDNAKELRYRTVDPEIENVVVVGGGHIGMEAAVAFQRAGKKVHLIDTVAYPLEVYLDKQLGEILRQHLEDHDVSFESNQRVQRIEGEDGHVTKVHTDKGSYDADLVIVSTGVRPNTKFLEGALELDDRGFVQVDDYMQTSAKDVFAVGNATKIKYNPTGQYISVALATNARKQGRYAAKNLDKPEYPFPGVQGSSAMRIFDLKMASTGISAKTGERAGVAFDSVYVVMDNLCNFAPADWKKPVHAKLYFSTENRKVLGAQLISEVDVTEMINTASLAIMKKMTVDELAYADFFFQPTYSRPWSILNVLGMEAQKKLDTNKK